MTGDEAYHAECFRCVHCESKIDDLVFAKTSQGIFCMKCHQERKEAKRQREERERMERADRMMDKILPTIPEAEQKRPDSSKSSGRYHPLESSLNGIDHSFTDTPRPPLPQSLKHTQLDSGVHGMNGSKFSSTPRTDSRAKGSSNGLSSIDVGPPFLPPLAFGLDDPGSSGFDLGEMLSGSEKDSKESTPSSIPTSPTKDIESQKRNSQRASVGRTSVRLSTSTVNTSDKSSLNDETGPSIDGQEPKSTLAAKRSSTRLGESAARLSLLQPLDELDGLSPADAAALIRELRMEVARHNPESPLIQGTPQKEFILLQEKTDRLAQKHDELEKSLRDMYIEKDLLAMDLEAMNEEFKAKEEALANSNTQEKLQARPTSINPRLSTNHEFMKQAYQVEVKALQEQKERLQQEIRGYVEQRDGVLDEMQILSVRNAELSTINNDMMREMQGRNAKHAPSAPSATYNGGMLQNFTGKMRRQRQPSGGSQQELKVAGSNDSTHSFMSSNSDEGSRNHHGSSRSKNERTEDIFGEEIITPKKFNWKKGTMNTVSTGVNTVKTVGAMFGKLLVEGPSTGMEAPNNKVAPLVSDNGSSNGQILPPTRPFSNSSETRSLNGRFTEQHSFIQYNYLKPTRCECCEEKIWGREYRCRGCGFQVHGRCIHEIMPGCSGKFKDSDSASLRNITPSGGSNLGMPAPAPPPKQIMFGNDLLEQLEQEQRTIPLVVEKCIEAVDERGLDVEGIYRRSGMAAEARQLVQAYDTGYYPDLMDTSFYQDICSITSVLKQYLRSLPEPLIPYDLYPDFMEAIGLPQNDAKVGTFRELMEKMPYAHYATLKVLMEHLNRVAERDSVNLMTSKNLSVVFGPTLMRNPDPNREILDMTYKNMTIEYLILNTSDLFVRKEKERSFSTSSHTSANGTNSLTVNGTNGGANGFPVGYTGQRQGSVGSLTNQMVPPPRRAAGGPMPTLPPRSSSGDAVPTINQAHSHHQQQHQQQYHAQHPYGYQQQQQQQQQQQFYRPQAFQAPQHQTLQQLKQQQQQREQQQREQQQREHEEQEQQQGQEHSSAPTPTKIGSPKSVEEGVSDDGSQALQGNGSPIVPSQQQQQFNAEMTHFS
ncbi:hypothetical protein BGZ51_003153 [Haplosporangium sp. Z 767]|nr:hypothetical protein BGZ51_003153 [Haplosporangium sp. Z 767]KAF9185115.1 hypothetical protein BGZ50_003259 [Haplosporangium sp. Z 11]